MSSNTVLRFTHERDTKNTRRYQEVDEKGNVIDLSEAVIGTLYLKKSINPPDDLEVEIRPA
jgi:hypothetical protein